jgi:class 3 adenylate cyclase
MSIRKKIVGISLGLILLMAVTSIISKTYADKVEYLFVEMVNKYVPAYGDLASMNIHSVERALAIRRMINDKLQNPPDDQAYAARFEIYKAKGQDIDNEAGSARKIINSIIDDVNSPSDNAGLARIDNRIEHLMEGLGHHLTDQTAKILAFIEARNWEKVSLNIDDLNQLRDEFNKELDGIRSAMMDQVSASAATVLEYQHRSTLMSAIITGLAAVFGFGFALLVSSGITRRARELLAGARDVEAGHLEKEIEVTTRDEIGELAGAFNRMVEQLRTNQRIRETFGRYVDPKVVEDVMERPTLAATEGQRRTMTVLFCDMKGFTSMSEGMTPQGLVKVMNHYLTLMSEPIRAHKGIIDKYIGDAVMAYWGPPFIPAEDQARCACLAAVDMAVQITTLRRDIPELLGVRSIPGEFDIRIGVATGEVLVGSIGSEFMMSYTVMGDAVNSASRLEGANKAYGTRVLITETTAATADAEIEMREVDRVVMIGQHYATTIFEIMGRAGELTPEQLSLRTKYAEGLAAYRAGLWDEAALAFQAALEAVPGDGPSITLARRVDILRVNPPPVNWDGAWHLDQK